MKKILLDNLELPEEEIFKENPELPEVEVFTEIIRLPTGEEPAKNRNTINCWKEWRNGKEQFYRLCLNILNYRKGKVKIVLNDGELSGYTLEFDMEVVPGIHGERYEIKNIFLNKSGEIYKLGFYVSGIGQWNYNPETDDSNYWKNFLEVFSRYFPEELLEGIE